MEPFLVVALVDDHGQTVTSDSVTAVSASPAERFLSATVVTAKQGRATFDDLVLRASSTPVINVTIAAFVRKGQLSELVFSPPGLRCCAGGVLASARAQLWCDCGMAVFRCRGCASTAHDARVPSRRSRLRESVRALRTRHLLAAEASQVRDLSAFTLCCVRAPCVGTSGDVC